MSKKNEELKECPCRITQGTHRGPAPIPQEGKYTFLKEITQVNGYSHGVGGCAPRQGACKLTINVKDGIIQEALIETIGCSGMTHSAAMAAEILPGKTLLEALNTDLVCDAINAAMKDVFQQLVYGRSQGAFSCGGLHVGAGLEELGDTHASRIGTTYSNINSGPRYYHTTEGYITRLALNENNEIIGYEYVNLPRLILQLKTGSDVETALDKASGKYGRWDDAVKYLNTVEE